MAVSKDKTRTLITLLKKDKEKLEQIAREQNRSFSNLVETILKEYLASK